MKRERIRWVMDLGNDDDQERRKTNVCQMSALIGRLI